MKQLHQKDREDKEEELEDVRQSCQKRVRKQQAQLCPGSPQVQPGCLVLRAGGVPGPGARLCSHLRP